MRLTSLPKGKDGRWEGETILLNHYSESCMRSLTYQWKQARKQRRTGFFLNTVIDSFDLIPILCIWLVIVDLLRPQQLFAPLLKSRCIWCTSHAAKVDCKRQYDYKWNKWKQILPALPLVMENSRFGAVSTNGCESELRYAVADVSQDNESCYLETGRVATRNGKPSNIFILEFFKSKLQSFKSFPRW